MKAGLHKMCNRFPHILRYWRPRGLLLKKNAEEIGGQIYKWLWFYISFAKTN